MMSLSQGRRLRKPVRFAYFALPFTASYVTFLIHSLVDLIQSHSFKFHMYVTGSQIYASSPELPANILTTYFTGPLRCL